MRPGLAWPGLLARHTHTAARSPGGLTRGRGQSSPGDESVGSLGLSARLGCANLFDPCCAFAAADPWVLRRRVLRVERVLPCLGEVDEVLRRHADLQVQVL